MFDSAHVFLCCCRWWGIKASPQEGHRAGKGLLSFQSMLTAAQAADRCALHCQLLLPGPVFGHEELQQTVLKERQTQSMRQRKKSWITPAISMHYLYHLNFKEQTTQPISLSEGLQGQQAADTQDKGKSIMAIDPQRALGPTQALFPDICSRQEDLLVLKVPPPAVISSPIRQIQNLIWVDFLPKMDRD